MKKIINSENIEKAEAFISDLERYANAIKNTKMAIHAIGLKEVSSDLVIETVRGNFDSLHRKCDSLIKSDLSGFNSPIVSSGLKSSFDNKVAEIRMKIADFSHSIRVGGRMFGDPDLEQYIEWDQSGNPFLSDEMKQKVKESFITYVSPKMHKLYFAHKEVAEKIQSFLNELSNAEMDHGRGSALSPQLYFLQFITITEDQGRYKVDAKPINYNYAAEVSAEEWNAEAKEIEASESLDD